MGAAFIILILFAVSVFAQEQPSTTENPLAQLKEHVKDVLAGAQLPFTEDQEREIVLMMEERRQSSEDLFGQIMDFRSGPTQGQEADRLRSAIEWMRSEFLSRLQNYLTPEQLTVWTEFESAGGLEPEPKNIVEGETRGVSQRQTQRTQFVRINNNNFTAEDSGYSGGLVDSGNNFQGGRGGNRTEVIERGGVGAFHGNAQFLFKDESLNARNPFAHNKPPYQERQASFDFGGPVIPNRLTATFFASRNEAENVDTIHATLPDGVFDLGIVRPTVNRSTNTRGIYQFTDQHSLSFNARYQTQIRKNQGIGGFNMLERASNGGGNSWNLDLRQFSTFSPRTLYEKRFNFNRNHSETKPVSEKVSIVVLDAFSSGGAQNRSEDNNRSYEFGNLFTHFGEKVTLKTGIDGVFRNERTISQNNFVGTFTFSSLDAYLRGEPLTYRVTRGIPELQVKQLEMSFFAQNDIKLNPQLNLMLGLRYDRQTNLGDSNNLGPRLAVAYAPSRATVVRAGAGIYYQRVGQNVTEIQRRLDGTRQHEIVIDNPSFPDPFQAGTFRETFPSIRVTDPDLVAPYIFVTSVSVERTFFSNLLVTAAYNFNRDNHRLRTRNLNAPLPGASARPDPTRGNILNLESTALAKSQDLRLSLRQRFSIFNVTANYTRRSVNHDAPPGNNFDPASNSYDLRADWGRALQRQNFNGSVNARMPLGVFLTGTVNFTGSRPYNITTGKDDNGDTQINDRPPGTARNAGNGPNSLSFAFNISKAFFFGEPPAGNGSGRSRANMNLFANMTNAFNRVNYGPPSGVMTSPNFGKSTSAQDPREIEVGLRFQF